MRVMKKDITFNSACCIHIYNTGSTSITGPHWENMPVKVYIEENPKEYIMKKLSTSGNQLLTEW